MPTKYRQFRETSHFSRSELTAVTFNVAKGSQRRMDAIIGDVMKLHKGLWNDGHRRHCIIGLQEIGTWAELSQPKTHRHMIFMGRPSLSDCGFLFPRDLIPSIVSMVWGERYFIIAAINVVFVAMHLVWTEEAADTLENIQKHIYEIKASFPQCTEVIFCSDSNVSLTKNATTPCRTSVMTGGAVVESSHSTRNRQEFLSFLWSFEALVASTFGSGSDRSLIHTWRRHRKKIETTLTNTSQIDHIATTQGIEVLQNVVGTWMVQQKTCNSRTWIIWKSYHWPVLQALRLPDFSSSDGTISKGQQFPEVRIQYL